MNLKKRELVISIVLIMIFTILCLSVNVYATSNTPTWEEYQQQLNNTNNNVENITQIATTNENKDNSIPTNNTTNNNNNNTSGELANTGLEDAPWVIIAVCVVSAVFAYKKIKEYKLD